MEIMLLKIGFHPKWVSNVISCVRSVKISSEIKWSYFRHYYSKKRCKARWPIIPLLIYHMFLMAINDNFKKSEWKEIQWHKSMYTCHIYSLQMTPYYSLRPRKEVLRESRAYCQHMKESQFRELTIVNQKFVWAIILQYMTDWWLVLPSM